MSKPAEKHKEYHFIKEGVLVSHPVFGKGTVTSLEGVGNNFRALINFDAHGEKWVMVGFAHLELVGLKENNKNGFKGLLKKILKFFNKIK